MKGSARIVGNFTFLVGVAAAAVVLVIPAYVYDWEPIREIVIFGELLAVSAIIMCLLLVMADVGRPDHLWHMIPVIGYINFPRSLLAWDMVVLNAYFAVNFVVVTHILYRAFTGRRYAKKLVVPLVLLSIRMAVGIHTVTASLYNGLGAAVLELVDPRAAVPGLGLLLGAGDPAHRPAAAAPGHLVPDSRRSDLEDRRADGLRHVREPVPARRRSLQPTGSPSISAVWRLMPAATLKREWA